MIKLIDMALVSKNQSCFVDLWYSSTVCEIRCSAESLFYKKNDDGGLNLSNWFVYSSGYDSV